MRAISDPPMLETESPQRQAPFLFLKRWLPRQKTSIECEVFQGARQWLECSSVVGLFLACTRSWVCLQHGVGREFWHLPETADKSRKYTYSSRTPLKVKLFNLLQEAREERLSVETATKMAQKHEVMRNAPQRESSTEVQRLTQRAGTPVQSLRPNSKLSSYKHDSGKSLDPSLG